jgi:hypothetical protein
MYSAHLSSVMTPSKRTESQRQSPYVLQFLTHLQVEIHIMLSFERGRKAVQESKIK